MCMYMYIGFVDTIGKKSALPLLNVGQCNRITLHKPRVEPEV
jgi:hypothetical protein